MSDAIRVLVVDNHAMFAEALASVLGEHDDIEVLGTAGTVADGLRLVTELGPDVVLMDYRLPDGTGVEATRGMRERGCEAAVVMVTASEDDAVVSAAVEAGCSGFVLKQDGLDDLVGAVRTAHAGGSVIPPRMLRGLLGRLRGDEDENPGLTPREVDVLRLLAEGVDTRGIAQRLSLSHNTARNHVQAVLRKLGAHSKLEAVVMALRMGLVPTPPGGEQPG